jgi:hypothetical protein
MGVVRKRKVQKFGGDSSTAAGEEMRLAWLD